MHWGDLICRQVRRFGPLVIGIDPSIDEMPDCLAAQPDVLERYVTLLLEAGQDRVGIVKFQSAHFEAFGSAGIAALARGLGEARERGFATILDVKRGDIGSTAEAYARAYLDPGYSGGSDLEADCITVNPFLGPETVEPYVERARAYGKGVLVLVKTSNPGSGWLQDQWLDKGTVSELIARRVDAWAEETVGSEGVGAVGAVVGATYAEEAERLRALMPRSVILAPGLGAQRGDCRALAALARPYSPVIVSASRGIAATPGRAMRLEDYRTLLVSRIDGFAAQVTGGAHAEPRASDTVPSAPDPLSAVSR